MEVQKVNNCKYLGALWLHLIESWKFIIQKPFISNRVLKPINRQPGSNKLLIFGIFTMGIRNLWILMPTSVGLLAFLQPFGSNNKKAEIRFSFVFEQTTFFATSEPLPVGPVLVVQGPQVPEWGLRQWLYRENALGGTQRNQVHFPVCRWVEAQDL
jgi:hypothetical protein